MFSFFHSLVRGTRQSDTCTDWHGGVGGTLIYSFIHRLRSFFFFLGGGGSNCEFQFIIIIYFFLGGGVRKINIFGDMKILGVITKIELYNGHFYAF